MAGREARGLELRVSPRGQRTGVAFFRNTRHTDRNFSRRSTDGAVSSASFFFLFSFIFPPFFFFCLSLSLSLVPRRIFYSRRTRFRAFYPPPLLCFSTLARSLDVSHSPVLSSGRLRCVLACVSRFSLSFPQVEAGVR